MPFFTPDEIQYVILSTKTAREFKGQEQANGLDALKAEAICYAVYESAWLGQPVKVKDVLEGKVDNYQRELDEKLDI